METIKQMRGIDYILDDNGLGADIANYVMSRKPTANSYDITSKDLEIILQGKIEDALKENNLIDRKWWDVFDENDHKFRNLFLTINALGSFQDIITFYDELANKVNTYIVDELTPLEERDLC